jgi:hypothetical protein
MMSAIQAYLFKTMLFNLKIVIKKAILAAQIKMLPISN